MKITSSGMTGESSPSLISGHVSIMINPRNVVSEAMHIFPRIMKMLPIPATRVNFPACLRIKRKPLIAEEQKFSEVRAI